MARKKLISLKNSNKKSFLRVLPVLKISGFRNQYHHKTLEWKILRPSQLDHDWSKADVRDHSEEKFGD